MADREEISRGLPEGVQLTEIETRIGRDPSVVSREVGRHGGRGAYRAHAAQEAAALSCERPKPLAVDRHPRLPAVVHRMLVGGWSPASIAGRLPIDYPDDHPCRVSHEATYTWV
ncbi:helix-turn-helix domain-containing protein [Aeromicrobium sp.]|uniref:helix-turn-helix domain-containing protein n=1 Tax=Aeromicrobium sp. TaxID=1871063 RepID=UPI00199A1AA7|nr:helix-turn-helix domain-containing protein [Aeromicrobium sp.]MBC7631322.1 helix-turn-helix domain-containing protein [Aeromicrobium sp.]